MKRNYVWGFKDVMLFTVESGSIKEAAHFLQGKLWADYVSNILPDFPDDGCMAVHCNLPCSNLTQTHRAWLLKSNHTLISSFPSCFGTQDGSSSSQIHPTYLSFWLWWERRQLLPSVKGETWSRVTVSVQVLRRAQSDKGTVTSFRTRALRSPLLIWPRGLSRETWAWSIV